MAWARGNRRRATGEGQQAPTDVMLFDNESSVVNDPFGRNRPYQQVLMSEKLRVMSPYSLPQEKTASITAKHPARFCQLCFWLTLSGVGVKVVALVLQGILV